MKKIILSIAYILVASSFLFAQEEQSQHELTINLGGGLSTLGLQTESSKLGLDGPLMPKLGGSLGLGYTYHINNQFGIGTGIEANFYRSEYSNDNLIGNYRDIDPKNQDEYFQLNYNYSERYKEIQNAIFVQIPLMLQFQTGDYHKFYVAVGGRVGIPVYTQFNTDASALTTSGFYSFEKATYENLPTKGFTDYDSPKTDGKLSLKTAYMASLELGMKWALNDNFNLYTGIYGDYGLNDIQKVKNKGTVTYNHEGTISPKPDPENQNFLAFNNSVTSTSAVQKIIPMTFGIKLRLSFGLGETKVGSAKVKAIAQQQNAYYQAAAEVAYKDAEAARLDNVEEDYAPPGASMADTRPQITAQELKILLEPIWGFDITKTVLTAEMKRILDRKIPILKKYWYLGIVLQGHTCDIGSEQINERFGYERAQAVKEYFAKNGLTSTRFSTVSKGKHYPAVQNSSEEHRKRNRRVELSIKK